MASGQSLILGQRIGSFGDEARRTYRTGAPVLPWIFAIAKHVRVDGYRKRRRLQQHEMATESLPETSPFPEAAQAAAPTFETLIAELPESQREVLTMLKVNGLSLDEVAFPVRQESIWVSGPYAIGGTSSGALRGRALENPDRVTARGSPVQRGAALQQRGSRGEQHREPAERQAQAISEKGTTPRISTVSPLTRGTIPLGSHLPTRKPFPAAGPTSAWSPLIGGR